MRHLTRALLVAAASLALSGCLGFSTDEPYPVTGSVVNPTPVRGYKVLCQSEPGFFNFVNAEFTTACQQVIVPVETRTVVRARG